MAHAENPDVAALLAAQPLAGLDDTPEKLVARAKCVESALNALNEVPVGSVPMSEERDLEEARDALCDLEAMLIQKTEVPFSKPMARRMALARGVRVLYEAAAKQGDITAAAHLATCLNYAVGGSSDAAQHAHWVNVAANAGSALARGMRAENYWFGENGFPVDYQRCEAEARQAKDGGSWQGATVLTWCLKRIAAELQASADVEKQRQAEALLEEVDAILRSTLPTQLQLSHTGDAIAQDWLAWRYANGELCTPDAALGFKWFLRSAVSGCAWAQHWVGERLSKGVGLPAADVEMARRWWRVAAAQGCKDAAASLQGSLSQGPL